MNINEQVMQMKQFYLTQQTKEYAYRMAALEKLHTAIKNNETKILEALESDLGKSANEGYLSELSVVYQELSYMRKALKKLMSPKRVAANLATFPCRAFKHAEPLGVVLIMVPWNYPINLSLVPLIDAIAAGNCVVMRPSQTSPACSHVLNEILSNTFSDNYIRVVEGNHEVANELLAQRFDLIFFTGSPKVGKTIMEAAAKNLTPVVLELGGKSPVIIDETCDIKLAAKRLAFGKCLNSGQTCIAPDYLFIPESIRESFIHHFAEYVSEFYEGDPLHCATYPHMVNQRQFDRVVGLLNDCEIAYGGQSDMETLKIAPTLVDHPSVDHPIMQEEIFGPVLPMLPYENLNEVIEYINEHEKPLALYMFSTNQASINRIIKEVSYGGGCINDTILHLANENLPFGGIGNSGMGAYHGAKGFETFSHIKSVLEKGKSLDWSFRYPPFKKSKLKILRSLIK